MVKISTINLHKIQERYRYPLCPIQPIKYPTQRLGLGGHITSREMDVSIVSDEE